MVELFSSLGVTSNGWRILLRRESLKRGTKEVRCYRPRGCTRVLLAGEKEVKMVAEHQFVGILLHPTCHTRRERRGGGRNAKVVYPAAPVEKPLLLALLIPLFASFWRRRQIPSNFGLLSRDRCGLGRYLDSTTRGKRFIRRARLARVFALTLI